ncbi:hypothetical protein [Oceanobacter mangrovi]|uniref:hypothetical protein n=1 Tax=Oceanobacter mangrovi TaxID=2862510 RepID=UPI001C8D35D0|nr:hypothetical protein [Oceanobacter mangrovi]
MTTDATTAPSGATISLLDSSQLARVGNQLGTNPAGVYADAQGNRYYIKTLESLAHARNERVAAALYQLAGAPTLEYIDTSDPCQVATRWLALDKKHLAYFTDDERLQAQQWLAVHAWTANWDAAGYDGDNQGCCNGTVLTLDVGGALAFRAQGDPKGKAFGTEVNELNSLRTDPDNPNAVRLFGDMNKTEIQQSIERVIRLPDNQIREVILAHNGSEKLLLKMLARKADMASRLMEYQ